MSEAENSLEQQCYLAILSADPAEKVELTDTLWRRWREGELHRHGSVEIREIRDPGRPPRLKLVPPAALERRGMHTQRGKAALVHAIAHIEFNAIDLALDAVYRFPRMPCQYYDDWLSIAVEEAYHFSLVRDYLVSLGYDYGAFTAHNGLWDMAMRTQSDVLVRMALVPRVLEARGLDVTPGIIRRFEDIGDTDFVHILNIIQRDEVGHVEKGSRWFHYLCDERGLPRQETFEELFQQYTQARIKLPLARDARMQAGFTIEELAYLEGLA